MSQYDINPEFKTESTWQPPADWTPYVNPVDWEIQPDSVINEVLADVVTQPASIDVGGLIQTARTVEGDPESVPTAVEFIDGYVLLMHVSPEGVVNAVKSRLDDTSQSEQ